MAAASASAVLNGALAVCGGCYRSYWRGSTASAAFDILALDGDDLRGLPLPIRKTNLARLLARRPDGIFVAPFEQGEIGPDLFRKACEFGLEGLGGPVEALGQVKNRQDPAMERVLDDQR